MGGMGLCSADSEAQCFRRSVLELGVSQGREDLNWAAPRAREGSCENTLSYAYGFAQCVCVDTYLCFFYLTHYLPSDSGGFLPYILRIVDTQRILIKINPHFLRLVLTFKHG